jgi:hypothetical protein
MSAPATYRSGTPQSQSRGSVGRLPGGTPILFALAPLRSVPQAGSQFRGLTTAIHEISGLVYLKIEDWRMFVNTKDYFLA